MAQSKNHMTLPKEMIFPVGLYCGAPYFLPPEGFDYPGETRRLLEANDRLADEVGELPAELLSPKSRITASFIYAQPPDYHGKNMYYASIHAWKEVFHRFREMHIDTVIFQASLWRELNSCFYRSKHYCSMNCYGVLERMFAAAESEKMTVYLGGYGSVAGWKEKLTRQELQQELQHHKNCFDELRQLGKFSGMYFPSETAFSGERHPEKERRLNTLYRSFSDMIKSADPDLKIIISPATMHDPKENECFKDFWSSALDSCFVDILMPQDCIGNTLSSLRDLPLQWQAWKEIADRNKMKLWSHTEIFERRSYYVENSIHPASPERVAAQLALTAPFAEKHCCWEALSLTSDEAGPEGRRLRHSMISGIYL